MVDRERLEQMRAFADEVRADLEKRELEDPLGALELQQRAAIRPPPVVFKTTETSRAEPPGNLPEVDQAPFDDLQIDVLASAIAQLRQDLDVTADKVVKKGLTGLRLRTTNGRSP